MYRQALPPGWDQKVAYRKNLLMSNLLVLCAGGATILLLRMASPPVQTVLAFGQNDPRSLDGTEESQFDPLGDPSGAQQVASAMAITLFRLGSRHFVIIPDETQKAHKPTNQITETTSASPIPTPAREEGAFDYLNSGYWGRLDGVGDLPFKEIPHRSVLPSLGPVGRFPRAGIGTLQLRPGDIVSRPVVDVRWIRSPVTQKPKDTAIVRVDMLVGKDTLDVQIIDEMPSDRGFGRATLEGLRRGAHQPMIVNGQERLSQIELTIFFCLDCQQVNLAVQEIKVRY
jgi:hypothetical protein